VGLLEPQCIGNREIFLALATIPGALLGFFERRF
jgi:hypothetical protein